jgi:uncharacterized membrane protein YfcA
VLRAVIDGTIPVDWRLIVALLTVVLAGVAKGVTGMGLPVAGVPILVALYGDLRLVLLTTIFATALSDVPMLWRFRKSYREASILGGFLICGLIGIIIGTRILIYVRVSILAGVLAAVVIAFILVSWFGRVPTMSRVMATRLGPLIGLACGVIQGSAGASGPIVTTYLVSSQLSRDGFLFAINAIFCVLDWTQFVSLHLHLTTAAIWESALVVVVLVFAGMGLGFAIQKRIDDTIFRRAVLVMLACAAVGLVVRALRG